MEGYFVLWRALWCSWCQQGVLVLSLRSLATSARTVYNLFGHYGTWLISFFFETLSRSESIFDIVLVAFYKFFKTFREPCSTFQHPTASCRTSESIFGFHVLVRHCGVRAVNCITASVRCATCFRQHWSRDERTNS